jgi:hypothetical protein
MSYENDPATALLATDCAVCNRALRDAVSVEAGIGPDCRRKYGYGEAQGDADWSAFDGILAAAPFDLVAALVPARGDAHRTANILVHRAACAARDERAIHARLVGALGYTVLAAALARGAGDVVEVQPLDDESLTVRAPYSPAFNDALRRQRVGARWDREVRTSAKRPGAWVVPATATAKRGLLAALREAFTGTLLVSARGVTQL